MPTLKAEYHGAEIQLEVQRETAVLRVNNVVRDSAAQDSVKPAKPLRLSSTVQTGYEWHEFIEGHVSSTDGRVLLSLHANSKCIASDEFNF